MNLLARSLLCGAVGIGIPAQESLWGLFGPYDVQYNTLAPFGDFNGDGVRDVIVGLFPFAAPNPLAWIQEVRVLSGADSSVLWQGQVYGSHTIRAAGDMDGDGLPDLAVRDMGGLGFSGIYVFSTRTKQVLWSAFGPFGVYGWDLISDIDTDGDGRPDLVALTRGIQSELSIYANDGTLRYALPCWPFGLEALSLAKMGDMDADGCDDFLVGCSNYNTGAHGVVLIISGKTGTVLRISQGLLPGDKTFDHVTNLGDIDGDGINDYAAFPWWSAQRPIALLWSGATGAIIRALNPVYTESVVADQDLDLDGVNDLVLGWEYPVNPPNVYGRTDAISGRDGTQLWVVENFSGSGQGSSGWGRFSAGIGPVPGSPYPGVAWMDLLFVDYTQQLNLANGRVRAFRGTPAGQGPVTGTACTSSGTLPLIGARRTATGSRITIAKSHPNAFAALWLSLNPLPQPLDLSPLGASGCNLYVGADATFLRVLGSTGIDRGYAAVDLPFQLAAAGVGIGIVGEWIVLDPATLDHATTQMHALRLQ